MPQATGSPSFVRLTAAVGAVALAAIACGGPNGNPQGQTSALHSSYSPVKGTAGGQLVFSDWEQVTDLNPVTSSAATTTQATNVIWADLWRFGPDNKPVADMVTDVPTAENGMVKKLDDKHMDITVKLKPGLNWSDGTPITTADVQFTWQAVCDPDTGASSTTGFDHITSMDVKSQTEMVWHFGPNTKGNCGLTDNLDSGLYSPYLLLGYAPLTIMPMHVLQSVKHADWHTNPYFTQKPTAVSGPYMVQSFVPGSSAQIVMVPNPHFADGRGSAQFYGHKPYLDKLIYKIYGDKPAQINGLKTGDTDAGLDLIANDLPALNSISQDKTIHGLQLLSEFLTVNVSNNEKGCAAQKYAETCGKATVFKDDQTLRQALALATDKATINTQLVQGAGQVMNSPFMNNFAPWYDKSLPAFKYDVAKANSMLDGDGWTKGADGIRVKNGRQLAFTISTTSGNSQRAAEEELLVHDWAMIGAKVTTENHPAGEFFGGFSENGILATGQYDVGLYANNWSPDPDSWGLIALKGQIPSAANPSGQNWGRWRDDKLDSLFTQGENTVDLNKRIDIYNQAQREWESYSGQIELYVRPDVFTYAPVFGNFIPDSPNLGSWNAADWFRRTGSS